jgi:hypothetical protein
MEWFRIGSTTLILGLSSPVAWGADGGGDVRFAMLHVGVHGDAGTAHDIAADGAAGLCDVQFSRVVCPATGPVTFRWGPGPSSGWELTGATVVEPGHTGVAWVLAPESSREAERARLARTTVTPTDVRDLFFATGDHEVPTPSMGMLQDLFSLVDHPDPLVRRQLIDALVPWFRHTASDPLSADAPQLVPPGLITQLAMDPDKVVRRRLANRLRDVNMPGEPLQAEANTALHYLVSLPNSTRPATASLGVLAKAGRANAEESWISALGRVTTPGPKGRAAANALARLAQVLEPSDVVDPQRGLALVVQHHRERTWRYWNAWRDDLPFDRSTFDLLLRDTLGAHQGLVRHFSEEAPDELAEALAAWEPSPPHSARWSLVTQALQGTDHPALRVLLDDDGEAPAGP